MYAPGWYQDPTQRFWQRYHDGTQWTQHVVGPTGQQGTDPAAVDLAAIPPVPVSMTMPAAPSTNGMAVASMVLGILWLYWIGSILAVIFGFVAKRQIAASQGRQTGGGMATAGLVLGFIAGDPGLRARRLLRGAGRRRLRRPGVTVSAPVGAGGSL